MSSKLPDKRTIAGWWRDFQWLQVTADGEMTCKICTWRAETAGIGTSGKFVIGSTNYQRCLITLQKWPRMSYFTNHFLLYLNLVGKRVSLVCLLRPVTPFRGNFSWKICNLTRQINQVFLGSALIFRELGLASSSFLLNPIPGGVFYVRWPGGGAKLP